MNKKVGFKWVSKVLCCVVFGWMASTASAINVELTPSTVGYDYTNGIELQISGGLTNGETVIVEHFLDLNGNGAVDDSEFCLGTYRLTDGTAHAIDGVTNINRPFDKDVATNAAITSDIPLRKQDVELGIGGHLTRVSSPYGNFTPAVTEYVVTNAAYGQSVQGTVTSGGATMSGAMVVVLVDDMEYYASSFTDASGNFSISVPPGDYAVSAFRPGYLANFTSAPGFTLEQGVNKMVSINIPAATRSISGSVYAEDTGEGVPGLMLFLNSDADHMAIGYTDAQGNFTVPVSPGVWEIEVSELYPSLAGLMNLDEDVTGVDTTAGDVTGIDIPLNRVKSLIYGYVKDSNSNPVSGIEVYADSMQGEGESDSYTDSDGYFVLGVTEGDYWIGLSSDDLRQLGLIGQGTNLNNVQTAKAYRVDLSVAQGTARLAGRVTDDTDAPLSDIWVNVYNHELGFYFGADTDEEGYFSVYVVEGQWRLRLDSDASAERGLVSPEAVYDVATGQEITNITYQAKRTTSWIHGTIEDNQGNPIGQIGVTAWAQIDGKNYNLRLKTDSQGSFNFGVINGQWNLFVDNGELNERGYNSIESKNVTVSGADRTVNFVEPGNLPLEIETGWLPSANAGVYYEAYLGASGGEPPYSWSLMLGSSPLPPGLVLEDDGRIHGIPEAAGEYEFIVELADAEEQTTERILTINVQPPLRIANESLPTAFAGIDYEAWLMAENYSGQIEWSVVSNSLPAGLTLTSEGRIYGVPSATGTNTFTVRLTDENTSVEKELTIVVNPGLEITTGEVLPTGTQGEYYEVQLGAQGGEPPFNWTLRSGSAPLPDGLALSGSGLISGTLSTNGTFYFQLKVWDSGTPAQETYRVFELMLLPPPELVPAVLVPLRVDKGDAFKFIIQGKAGCGYLVQSSTDLINWTDVVTTNAPSDEFEFSGEQVSEKKVKFYRVLTLQ